MSDALPAPSLSLGLAAQVAMDEALLAMAMTPSRFPLPADSPGGAELAECRRDVLPPGLDRRPRLLPPHPAAADRRTTSTSSHGWAMGLGYERLTWDSGFAPHPGEPGGERWMAFEPNRTASAVVVRHAAARGPGSIAVHGFCMGFPFMDFRACTPPGCTASSG